jgi:hypothetical protein
MLRRTRERNPLTGQETGLAAVVFYNEACAHALGGQLEKAMASLQEAVLHGFDDVAGMRGDDDLQALHPLPQFQELVKRMEDAQNG